MDTLTAAGSRTILRSLRKLGQPACPGMVGVGDGCTGTAAVAAAGAESCQGFANNLCFSIYERVSGILYLRECPRLLTAGGSDILKLKINIL